MLDRCFPAPKRRNRHAQRQRIGLYLHVPAFIQPPFFGLGVLRTGADPIRFGSTFGFGGLAYRWLFIALIHLSLVNGREGEVLRTLCEPLTPDGKQNYGWRNCSCFADVELPGASDCRFVHQT